MLSDKLYELFEQQLYSTDFEPSTQEEFIYRVVESYVEDLIRSAHIPIQFLHTLQQDLEEEVRDMLKKKTYGYYSIREFRKAILTKKTEL